MKQLHWTKIIHPWFTHWHTTDNHYHIDYTDLPNNDYHYRLTIDNQYIGDFITLKQAKLFAQQHNEQMENQK